MRLLIIKMRIRRLGYRLRSVCYPHKAAVYWIDGPKGYLSADMGPGEVYAHALDWVREHRRTGIR